MSKQIPPSELILNSDESVYHLALKNGQLANDILLVGDPERVPLISQHFDQTEVKISKREFVTHTGRIGQKRLSVVSTGIGTDNIDIVLNEIHLVLRADLSKREFLPKADPVRLFRIGTSGSLDSEVLPGSFLISEKAIGLEGLAWYYPHSQAVSFEPAILHPNWNTRLAHPYLTSGSTQLINSFPENWKRGTTLTCSGFYHPQGRFLEEKPTFLSASEWNQLGVHNMEMETAGIYSLARHFEMEAVSLNAILANRLLGTFADNPQKIIQHLIEETLSTLTSNAHI